MTISDKNFDRANAALLLAGDFDLLTDKSDGWQDLRWLTQDQDSYVRWNAAYALGSIFFHIPDKSQGWEDLHCLTNDQEDYVRAEATCALGVAFLYIPDKSQGWEDLHRLARDPDRVVRWRAACAIGKAFPHLLERYLPETDLETLAKDSDKSIRAAANHTLGRIYILKATEVNDKGKFKIYLENAIGFFIESSKEAEDSNPAAFCLPFYRSLHGILFTDVSKDAEVQRYIEEARQAVKKSKSKESLLHAVENLSHALHEVKSYSFEDIVSKKRDLKAYTRYCFQAAECLSELRDVAPLASRMVDVAIVEKSLPIMDHRIKSLFRVVETAAGELCKKSKGTELESLGRSAYENSRDISEIKSPLEAELRLNNLFDRHLLPLLMARSKRVPRESQTYIDELMKIMETACLNDRLIALISFLTADLVRGENEDRYKMILFHISRLSYSTGDVKHKLRALDDEIRKLNGMMQFQGLGIQEMRHILVADDQFSIENLEDMRNDLHQKLNDIEGLIQKLPDDEDIKGLEQEIRSLKPSRTKDKIAIASDITSIVSFFGINLPTIIEHISKVKLI